MLFHVITKLALAVAKRLFKCSIQWCRGFVQEFVSCSDSLVARDYEINRL